MSAPERLSDMPLRVPVWLALVYVALVVWLGLLAGRGLSGVTSTVLVAMFSFQFWTFACWRGLRRRESLTTPPTAGPSGGWGQPPRGAPSGAPQSHSRNAAWPSE